MNDTKNKCSQYSLPEQTTLKNYEKTIEGMIKNYVKTI